MASSKTNTSKTTTVAVVRGGFALGTVQTRVDPSDGRRYSKMDFVRHYGGYAEWDAAGPRRFPDAYVI